MKVLNFKEHPTCIQNDDNLKSEKQVLLDLLKSLLKDDSDVRIDVFSDKGDKSPTKYKCNLLKPINEITSLDDFNFKLIDL